MTNKLTIDTPLNNTVLFDSTVDDSDTSVLNASNTGLNNLSNIRYPWAVDVYNMMRENFWTPEIVSMVNDELDTLPEEEVVAVKKLLSFLTFLDSIQTTNLPNLSNYITNPEIRGCLIEQTAQEFLHSKSYENIFTSLFTADETTDIYYEFLNDETLKARNQVVTDAYQFFIDQEEKTVGGLVKVMIANLALESIYFYNGFNFAGELYSQNRKIAGIFGTLKLIRRDEVGHISIFQGMLLGIMEQADDALKAFIKEQIREIILRTTNEEIAWSQYLLKDIASFTDSNIVTYTQYLAQSAVTPLGVILFEDTVNPYAYLDGLWNEDQGSSNRGNFFEANTGEYNQVQALGGFSDF